MTLVSSIETTYLFKKVVKYSPSKILGALIFEYIISYINGRRSLRFSEIITNHLGIFSTYAKWPQARQLSGN